MTQMMETVDAPIRRAHEDQMDSKFSAPVGVHEKFDYRPMPIVAPVAGVLASCSLIAYLGLFGIGLAIIGVFVGLLAMLTIHRSAGELSGMWLAAISTGLAASNAVAGVGLQVYHYQHEVPEGYERVNFTEQISKLGFDVKGGVQTVPESVEQLVGKKIFLKGFMYPTGQTEGLSGFLLLKDSGECCFGGQPALQDMVGVRFRPGKEVDYYSGRVAVAGTFKLNSRYQGGSLEPIYILEGEHFSRARTAF